MTPSTRFLWPGLALWLSLSGCSAFAADLPDMAQEAHPHEAGASTETPSTEANASEAQHTDTAVYKYVCPMHPQIVRDHEGTCPICGMALVKQLFDASESAPEVHVKGGASADGSLRQTFAVRTAEVQRTTLWKYIETFGKVVPDETQVVHIHPRASGWISDLSVRSNGDFVKKGALLYRIYSPEIVSAQQDFLQALQSQRKLGNSAKSIIESARVRLSLLGVDDQTVQVLQRKRRVMEQVPVYAPQSGYVSEMAVQNGMYIQPQTELMSLIGLNNVWVEAEVLPLQQAWVKQGLTVEVATDAYPGQTWESRIDYLYPTADPVLQALKVRIPLQNADEQRFKPNMLVDVTIYGGPKHSVLAIPMEAVIQDGTQSRVVVEQPNGGYRVAEIVTGMETRNWVEVLSGLKAGERIVTSGQFLIDSESQIQSNLKRMAGSSDSGAANHAHAH
ncbi:efflux transporter periplasmic adaptor subunit [Thiomicrospira sp. XS5]|uniref:efflux RND transporter periplasmic adaptor subunit n=1 Tax=Thiomicrospira sp. XS5 TaxID=1775636 RepID=UPI00074A8C3F|nr:efflux RND transporter periplasmic adaptor subunit [Thiomicrospira sp. XS5]KUJ73571.1 efflux transporter periplasmic adaptor subunit [Thiomicrospira sp. XS5]